MNQLSVILIASQVSINGNHELDNTNGHTVAASNACGNTGAPSSVKKSSAESLQAKISKLLVSLAARINVNSYGVIDSLRNTVLGFCLVPVAGLTICHSCLPNTYYYFHNGCMEYRLLKDIAIGEEITVSYVDQLEDTATRRNILSSTKHFFCRCIRCNYFDEAANLLLNGKIMPPSLFEAFCLEDKVNSVLALSKKTELKADKKVVANFFANLQPELFLSALHCEYCGINGAILLSKLSASLPESSSMTVILLYFAN